MRRYSDALLRRGTAGKPSLAEGFQHGDLPIPPARKAVVLTCMDARLMPDQFLGFGIGEVHVIRNAGALATDDAIRSLVISTNLLGTREILIIAHAGWRAN